MTFIAACRLAGSGNTDYKGKGLLAVSGCWGGRGLAVLDVGFDELRRHEACVVPHLARFARPVMRAATGRVSVGPPSNDTAWARLDSVCIHGRPLFAKLSLMMLSWWGLQPYIRIFLRRLSRLSLMESAELFLNHPSALCVHWAKRVLQLTV